MEILSLLELHSQFRRAKRTLRDSKIIAWVLDWTQGDSQEEILSLWIRPLMYASQGSNKPYLSMSAECKTVLNVEPKALPLFRRPPTLLGVVLRTDLLHAGQSRLHLNLFFPHPLFPHFSTVLHASHNQVCINYICICLLWHNHLNQSNVFSFGVSLSNIYKHL